MRTAMHTTITTNPAPAFTGFGRFPSRKAVLSPTAKRLTANGIGRQSMNEMAAASTQ
jgi:hypothetical protein